MSKITEYDEGFHDGYRASLDRIESLEIKVDSLLARLDAICRVQTSFNPINNQISTMIG